VERTHPDAGQLMSSMPVPDAIRRLVTFDAVGAKSEGLPNEDPGRSETEKAIDCASVSLPHHVLGPVHSLRGQERGVVWKHRVFVEKPFWGVLVAWGEGGKKGVESPREVEDGSARFRPEERSENASAGRDSHHVLVVSERAVEKFVGVRVGEDCAHENEVESDRCRVDRSSERVEGGDPLASTQIRTLGSCYSYGEVNNVVGRLELRPPLSYRYGLFCDRRRASNTVWPSSSRDSA
jgi:hypothetical protein